MNIMREVFSLIQNKYSYKPKHILLDREQTLQLQWKKLLTELGIEEQRTAPDIP